MISQHYFTFPFQLSRVVSQVRNWPLYLFNYLLRRNRSAEYLLRSGFRLIDNRGTLAGTIAVIFVRREYGRMQDDYRTIVDIGANMGAFVVYAAQACPNAKIYCFEPEQRNFEILKRNIAVNSLGMRVSAFQLAVASSNGDRAMAIGSSPMNSLVANEAWQSLMVHCTTLLEILKQQELETIDLLKMNCEGAEYEILAGCTRTELERIPRIRLEYHNLDAVNRNGKWLASYLTSQGYEIERFTRYRGESGFIWAALT
jgi:FkbM family methyltransferase